MFAVLKNIGFYYGITMLIINNVAQDTKEADRETLIETYRSLPRVNFSLATATEPNKIGYKLFTIKNPNGAIELTENNVKKYKLEKNVKTILLLHGWKADDTSPWYGDAKQNYFQNGPQNILYIDWSAYGNSTYEVSAANVKPVGEFIARFLINSMVPSENIHVIGHSMGGQVASFIGKSYENITGNKVGRITGLDPSGRRFGNKDMKENERLNKLDAAFVDVVHTNIQIYGFTKPCGHVDFYPNGGSVQPGCPDDEPFETCNHHRSYRFFVESIKILIDASEVNFEENENNHINITRKENPKIVGFGEHISLSATGMYSFKTNPYKPYLISNKSKKGNFLRIFNVLHSIFF